MICPGCSATIDVVPKSKHSSIICPQCNGMFPASFAQDLEDFEKEREKKIKERMEQDVKKD